MKWLFFVKSICAVAAAFAMLGWAVKTGGVGPVFSQPARVVGNAKSWAWVMSINVAVSGKTTLALNIVGWKSFTTCFKLQKMLTECLLHSLTSLATETSHQLLTGNFSSSPLSTGHSPSSELSLHPPVSPYTALYTGTQRPLSACGQTVLPRSSVLLPLVSQHWARISQQTRSQRAMIWRSLYHGG